MFRGFPALSKARRRWRPLSIRAKLGALTAALFVAFIWVLVFLSATILQRQFNAVLAEQQFATVMHIAADLDNKLKERIDGLRQAAGQLPAALEAGALEAYLAQESTLHVWFAAGIAVIGMDGRAIADYPAAPGRRGTYFGDRGYFRQVVATGKPYIDKPVMGRALKRPLLTIGVPVFDAAGKLRAVMTGITDLTAPNFLGLVSDRTLTGKGEFFVFSRHDEIIVAATDARRVLATTPARGLNPAFDRFVDGFEGSGLGVSSEGIPKLYSGKQVPIADWVVLAALPTAVAFGPVRNMQGYLYGIAAFMTLLAVLSARWLARRVLAPLDKAGRAMGRMTRGQAPLAPLPNGGQDEVGQLIGSFNRLVEGRQRYEAALADSEQRGRKLLRIYAVLSGINSAIVRLHERQSLLDAACRVAVEAGQFGIAWIGLLDETGATLRPAAGCGVDLGAIRDIPVAIGAAFGSGHATASEALSTGRAVFCNDIAAMGPIGPVRAQALRQGYRAVCVLPLVVDGKAIGVMGLYAREAGFFDAEEMKLLEELAADISFALQYIEREEKLDYLAYYDALTGLPNRTLFLDRLNQFVSGVKDGSHGVAVILFDLEHFTRLNETAGRQVGDAVLKEVAERLGAAVYEPCSLARPGADTFAVAVSAVRHGDEAAAVVQERIFAALSRPLLVEGKAVHIGAHAGIALYPGDGRDGAGLLQSAEAALKEAQSSGLRRLYYAPEINARAAANLALERDLRAALAAGQFVLHFQPRVDLLNGQMAGAEALLRWQHPERGLVPPAEFIPLAEHTGLIVPIGAWVIDTVCACQAAWRAEGVAIVPVAVNLSPVQFVHGDLQPTLTEALTRHGLDAKYLELELTESLVMQNPDMAARTMQAFRQRGLHLSLDDFGTGYSSLAYLQRFPFDFVKIDRAFVRDITENASSAAIATAVIAMAHQLKLQVVAEGVETEGQLRYLRQHGCDQIQGYFFSPPVAAEAFADMLRRGKRLEPEPVGLEA